MELCPKRKNPNLPRNRHFLKLTDFTREELQEIIDLSIILKRAHRQGVELPLLKDKSLAILFSQASTRTRVSFETAMTQLGGHALYISTNSIYHDHNESMRDTAEVISRMTEATVLRIGTHEAMEDYAKYSFTPVIDGCSDTSNEGTHPTQLIADFITMREHLPDKPWEDMVVMRIGDLNLDLDGFGMVGRALSQMCAIFGMTYVACTPKGMEPPKRDIDYFNKMAEKSGAKFIWTDDPYEHIDRADFLVADSFYFEGHEDPDFKTRRMAVLYPKYMIDKNLVSAGKSDIGVLHCMPGHRDVEISSEVWDGPNSLLFEEAENRLHAEKGILAWLLYDKQPSKELQAYHMGIAEDFLNSRSQH